jgi:diguanylate cyclase (GGDEF)-like protein
MSVRSVISSRTAGLHFAFQPIVGVHSGETYGFEALVRGTRELGYRSIAEYFSAISEEGLAVEIELELLELAATEFALFTAGAPTRLFFNQNTRVFEDPRFTFGAIRNVLSECGLPVERLCIELSEVERIDVARSGKVLRAEGLGPIVAIDDFGSGFSGLRLLSESRPNIVKIDRFFISGIDRDREKRNFLTHLFSLAHGLGILVVAEGVETDSEFLACRDLGCDLAQGYLIARPTSLISELKLAYPLVSEIVSRERKARAGASDALRDAMEDVPSIPIDAPMADVLKLFSEHHERSFFPVVGPNMEALGIVHEYKLKSLIYSPFGRQILTSVVSPQVLRDYLTPTLAFDIRSNVDLVLSAIAQRPDVSAVLVTQDDRYVGLLDTAAIIRTMHDRLIAGARDANPLTKLPGNVKISEYMVEALESGTRPLGFVYLDFDNFKPFNDRFGFRQGDRAIAMLADAMRAAFTSDEIFLGHIGGDDFFIGTTGRATEKTMAALPAFVARFSKNMESFYDEASRVAGASAAIDRNGASYAVPLLSVSGAGMVVAGDRSTLTLDGISQRLASLKLRAKRSPAKFELEVLATDPVRVPA